MLKLNAVLDMRNYIEEKQVKSIERKGKK